MVNNSLKMHVLFNLCTDVSLNSYVSDSQLVNIKVLKTFSLFIRDFLLITVAIVTLTIYDLISILLLVVVKQI